MHSFANSVYKVGRDDHDHPHHFGAGEVSPRDDDSDDSYSEDGEQSPDNSVNHNIENNNAFTQNFTNQPHR